MRRALDPGSPETVIVDEEQELLERVRSLLTERARSRAASEGRINPDYESDLVALRDQIAEEKAEDLPVLVEHMTRLQALAAGRAQRTEAPVDVGSPYFAHLRLAADDRGATRTRDVLIGRRGLIDRTAGVQIVDWRDAPVSRVYYRYDEGDDYDEEVGAATLRGAVLARRNVTISAGKLRRIGCPQGTLVSSGEGVWFALEGMAVPMLEGGQGTAVRPPAPIPTRGRGARSPRREVARRLGDDKALPEIAALIDRAQFDLITEPASGLVVIQGGAGSGKTTVALHRIAYLVFNEPAAFRPSCCLFVVPSEALSRYVAGVLPALGVRGIAVVTFRSWARTLRKRMVPLAPDRYADETPAAVSRLKKHPALLALLERVVDEEVRAVREALEALPYEDGAAGRDRLLQAWDERGEEPPVARLRAVTRAIERGRIQLATATARRVEHLLRAATTRLRDAHRVLFEVLTDAPRLEALRAPGVVDPASAAELSELVKWASAQLEEEQSAELEGIDEERRTAIDGRPLDDSLEGSGARGRIDPEDDALLLRLVQRLRGGFQRVDGEPLAYDHIAIDEAQDLSAVEIKVLYEATNARRSVTIAGDTAQRVIFDNGFRGWEALCGDVGLEAGRVRPLRLAYRSTAQVMAFARAVLGPLGDDAALDGGARQGAEVSLHAFEGMGEAVAFVAEALRSLLGRESAASIALITRHAGQADAWYAALAHAEVPMLRRVRRQDFPFRPGVDVTEVTQVKGLEFDYVILLDVNASSYPPSIEARHLLHIGATRATHQLWVVATGPRSELVASLLEAGGEGATEGQAGEAGGLQGELSTRFPPRPPAP